ncbi:MAG: hypothetical protein R3C53_06970 [Pirellulaceae bacterium]
MTESSNLEHHPVEDLISCGMFYLSLVFLALLATVMVLWIDVNRIVDISISDLDLEESDATEDVFRLSTGELARELAFEANAQRWGNYCAVFLILIWPVFVAESLVRRFGCWIPNSQERTFKYWWLFCVVPPLRLCAHQHGNWQTGLEGGQTRSRVWLPVLGWQEVNRNLRRRLERAFGVPMIWIALLILPILGAHYYYKEGIINYPYLRVLLHFGTGLIWFAFTVEFIVMVSLAEKKLEYCKRHWLDLAIILLPLISFLRSLRVLRAGRLLNVGRLQHFSRVVRVFRLRGVAMRAFRALLVLEIIHRLIRTKPEARIRSLEHQCAEKEHELAELREEIARLKQSLADPLD